MRSKHLHIRDGSLGYVHIRAYGCIGVWTCGSMGMGIWVYGGICEKVHGCMRGWEYDV